MTDASTNDTSALLRARKLRGRLPGEEPGSRGLESMARNRACLRLTALTLAGVNPAVAGVRVYGMPDPPPPSPFAVARGNRFEHALIADGAKELLALYRQDGRLDEHATALDMAVAYPLKFDLPPGAEFAAAAHRQLRERERASEQVVLDALAGRSTPDLVIKPRLMIEVAGVMHATEPDALVRDGRFYRPVEIKAYADRGAMTDQAKTGSACRQAAVAVVTLRQHAARAGVADPDRVAPAVCDLVFARGAFASLHAMLVDGEIESLTDAIDDAPGALDRVRALLGDEPLDTERALDLLPNAPTGACADHCALWERCQASAAASSDPLTLGDQAREVLAAAGSLERALALRDGAPPASDAEGVLADLLQSATAAWQEAIR